jgi:uncharacterized membrane protein
MESFVLLDEGAWMTVGLAGLKMLSIWWPVLLVAAVGTYWIYKQEEKEKKYESR